MIKHNAKGIRDRAGWFLMNLGERVMVARYCGQCLEKLDASGSGPCCGDPSNQKTQRQMDQINQNKQQENADSDGTWVPHFAQPIAYDLQIPHPPQKKIRP